MTNLLRHWKLNCIALVFIFLFVSLGQWQLGRAQQKKNLIAMYQQRINLPPLTINQLSSDSRFHRLALTGRFDNAHTVLLDNKTFHGKIGYEVYTPFISPDLEAPILVDRGFLAMKGERKHLPEIAPILNTKSVAGLLNLPPRYVALGNMVETKEATWPLRVEYINIQMLSPYTGRLFSPYVLLLPPADPAAFEIEWQISGMGPEKHQAYAIQWFAFALTLLIISIALNRRLAT